MVPGAEEKLRAALEAKVAASHLVPDTTTTVTMLPGRPAFIANAAAREWAKQAQAIYAELDGRKLRVSDMAGGATDAAFAGRSGKVPVIESFGLAGFATTRATNTSSSTRSRRASIS
jgi:glutamate carboxypeptidase